MNLDERAGTARAALVARAQVAARQRGEFSHRPMRGGRFGLGVAAVAVVGLIVAGLAWIGVRDPDGSNPVSTPSLTIREVPISRSNTIAAALVSSTGDVVVIVQAPAGLEGRRVRVDAGVPLTGDGVPGPRWMPDGRTIEFVAALDGDERVVRVDVYTARVATQPYSVTDGGDAKPSLDFMRGADGSAVRLVAGRGTRWWEFSSIRDGAPTEAVPFGSVTPLAPAPGGIVVSTDSRIAVRSDDGTHADVDTAAFGADQITAAAYAPGPRLLLGTQQGAIIDGTARITTSTGWPITALAWALDDDSVIAETSSQGRHAFFLCDLTQLECTDISNEDAGLIGVVRGSAQPTSVEQFAGVWPETTSAQAARVDTTRDPWRLEPEAVAARFAQDVLRWPDPIIGAEVMGPFAPWSSSFDVTREIAGPTANIQVSQLIGDDGWVVTYVSSPTPRFSSGYQGNEVTIGFDPQEAETSTVIVTINGQEFVSTATRGDPDFGDVTISIDGGIELPASALVLLEDDNQRVFAAYSAYFGDGPQLVAIG